MLHKQNYFPVTSEYSYFQEISRLFRKKSRFSYNFQTLSIEMRISGRKGSILLIKWTHFKDQYTITANYLQGKQMMC